MAGLLTRESGATPPMVWTGFPRRIKITSGSRGRDQKGTGDMRAIA